MTNYQIYAPDISFNPTDFQDKTNNVENIIKRFYARLSSLFIYDNLPDSIPVDVLELYLQHTGAVTFDECGGILTVNPLTFSGEHRDHNKRPTEALIVNPYQNPPNRTKTINSDCVVMRNDTMMLGLRDIISKYATLLAENELSMWMGIINSRIMSLMIASDSDQKKALDMYIEKIKNGELTAVLDDNMELSSISVQPYSNSSFQNQIIQMTEAEQYLIGSLYIELGIKGHYNTKRENISEAESQMGDDTLIPLIDDMLKNRQEALKMVNLIFGTDISVKLGSVWNDVKIDQKVEKVMDILEIENNFNEESTVSDATDEPVDSATIEETPTEETQEQDPEPEPEQEPEPEPEQNEEPDPIQEDIKEVIDNVVEDIIESIEEDEQNGNEIEGPVSKLLRKWRVV